MQTLVAASDAGGECEGESAVECEALAVAITRFAVSESTGDATVVAAVVEGVAAGAPALAAPALLEALAAAGDPETDVQDTVEEPQSISPSA